MRKQGKRVRNGNPVVVYTPTEAIRFQSRAEVISAYGISKQKLYQLMKTGKPLKDGITTFDEPIY